MKLPNDFHGTSIRIHLNGKDYLTARQVARAKKALCPGQCPCGSGICGERPAKQYDRQGDGACFLVGGQDGEALLIPCW